MPKMKTHKGAAKRFKKTASGKFKHRTIYRAKKMAKKSTDRKRRLRQGAMVDQTEAKRLRRVLPYA